MLLRPLAWELFLYPHYRIAVYWSALSPHPQPFAVAHVAPFHHFNRGYALGRIPGVFLNIDSKKGITVLKGLSDLGKMGGMLKQAMEMKGRMEELKEQLADERIEAESGGGMVRIVMNGKMELISIKIEPDIINADEAEVLETLVQAAINEGSRKAQEMVKAKMTEMAGGLDIPGLTS